MAADSRSAGEAVDNHPAAGAAGNRPAAEVVDNPPVVLAADNHPVPAAGSRRAEGEVVDCSSNLPKSRVRPLQGTADRGDDLVDEGLPLDVPQREQDGDEPDDSAETREHQVDELANDRHAETDWLPGLFADDLELHDALADARAGRALAIAQVPDHVGKCDQTGEGDRQLADRGCAGRAELTEVVFRCVGDAGGFARAHQQQPADTLDDQHRDVVDDVRQHARTPRRICLFRQCSTRPGLRREAPTLRRRREASTLRPGGGGYPPGGGGGGG